MSDPPTQNHPAATAAELLLRTVRQLMVELHPGQEYGAIHLDSSLGEDLGLDSLARVELLARIERAFHLTIPEQTLTTAETPRDFLRQIGAARPADPAFLAQLAQVRLAHPGAAAAPDTAQTLLEVLAWHVAEHPDRPHIRFYADDGDGEVLTFLELQQGAELVAAGLQARGLDNQEAVVIMLPSGREYFSSFFGVLMAGGIPVPVYPPGHVKQIEEHLRRHVAIIDNCLAGVMITMPETVTFARLLKQRGDRLRHVVTVAELTKPGAAGPPFRQPGIKANDIAFLQYTSGSTGTPKGVVLTHANLLANVRSMGQAIKVDANDVFVSWLPLYHDMGLIGAWLGSLYHACQLILMPPLAFIARPIRWLRAIHRFRGTLSAAPNFAYELCLRRLDDDALQGLDLGSWRIAFNGAEAISPHTLQRFVDRFQAYGFRPEAMSPVYGLAESSVGLAFPPLNRGVVIDCVQRAPFMETGRAMPTATTDTQGLCFVNCGRPLPGHQIRVVDEQDRELPDRHEGRIQFQGPSATSGYFRNPAKNAALFHGPWLETGDLGYIAAGDLYISGRSKDIIIRAGRNIYPEELEEAIGAIEGVRAGNVAVFGVNDPDAGTERLIVLAESRKQEAKARETVRQRINAAVTALTAMPPDEVVLARPNTVLKTSSGKIRRAACRELYEQGRLDRPQRAVWLQITRFALAAIGPRLRRARRQVAASLYAGYCWVLFGATSLGGWLLVLLLPNNDWRWSAVRFLLAPLLRFTGLRPQISGLDHLPPAHAPCILVANHASYLDAFILAHALPHRLGFVAKAELRQRWLPRIFLNRVGAIFVERFDRRQTVADAEQLLAAARAGRSLLFFAEGTLARMPGLLPFRMGPFETAVKGGLPVVPIVIRGTRSALRADSWFPRRAKLTVTIGAPLAPAPAEPAAGTDDWHLALALRDRTRTWMLRHCGEPDLQHERSPLNRPQP